MNFCIKIPLQYLVLIASGFSTLQSGLYIGWFSYAMPKYESENSPIRISNDEGSWMASIFLICVTVGGIITCFTIDLFGRRTMLMVASIPLCGSWLLIAFAQKSWQLHLASGVLGIADGILFSCIPLYIAEICDPKIRGGLITTAVGVSVIGQLLGNVLGTFLDMFAVAVVFSVLSLGTGLYLLVPESPYFYLIKGDLEKVKLTIEQFGKTRNSDELLASMQNTLTDQETKTQVCIELFSDLSNLKNLCLILMLRVFQLWTGNVGITFYAQTVFKKFQDILNPTVSISVYYLLQIAVFFLTAVLVDKVGRRFLLISSMTAIFIAMSIISIYFAFDDISDIDVSVYSWLPIVGLLLYVTGYAFGLMNVPFILLGELFPPRVKGCASSLFSVTFGILSVASVKVFQYTKDEYGMYLPFTLFAIFALCGIPFVIFCVTETKKKTLEEVQFELRSNHNR